MSTASLHLDLNLKDACFDIHDKHTFENCMASFTTACADFSPYRFWYTSEASDNAFLALDSLFQRFCHDFYAGGVIHGTFSTAGYINRYPCHAFLDAAPIWAASAS